MEQLILSEQASKVKADKIMLSLPCYNMCNLKSLLTQVTSSIYYVISHRTLTLYKHKGGTCRTNRGPQSYPSKHPFQIHLSSWSSVLHKMHWTVFDHSIRGTSWTSCSNATMSIFIGHFPLVTSLYYHFALYFPEIHTNFNIILDL